MCLAASDDDVWLAIGVEVGGFYIFDGDLGAAELVGFPLGIVFIFWDEEFNARNGARIHASPASDDLVAARAEEVCTG